MIEYALLFILGFMAAALLVMLVAPAVHQRIVRYTENRLKATMPLSPQEIRAQKDMARALYAAENAKTTHDLNREREKSMALSLSNDSLSKEAARLAADNQEIKAQIAEMSTEAADFRSRLRRADLDLTNLKETLRRTETAMAAKDLELDDLTRRLARSNTELDGTRNELTLREDEIESLRLRMQTVRDEREELRRETKLLSKRAKDAEMRLTQEEHKVMRLDDRLTREIGEKTDLEALVERRNRELSELRQKLKSSNKKLRSAVRSLQEANLPAPDIKDGPMIEIEDQPLPSLKAQEDDIRASQNDLTDRLLRAKAATDDDALREELGDIAARMLVLTAHREGASSPIPDLLSQRNGTKPPGSSKSLVDRVMQIDPNLGRGHSAPAE